SNTAITTITCGACEKRERSLATAASPASGRSARPRAATASPRAVRASPLMPRKRKGTRLPWSGTRTAEASMRCSSDGSGPGSDSCLAGTERRASSAARNKGFGLFAIAVTDVDGSIHGWYAWVHPRHRTHAEMIAEEPRPSLTTMSHQGPLRGPARLFEAVRRETVTELGGVLSGFWGTIEEQVRLEALAGHDYSGAQDDRMAVMALGHRALDLATRYRKTVEREFDPCRNPPAERTADQSLSLMSEGELEIHLAGQHTTELLDHQFLHPLEQLDERMQALAVALGVEGKRPNPVRPEAAVAAFVDLFGAEDLTRGLRPLVFNQFDKRLPEVLGELYGKLNELLGNAGFGVQSRGGSSGSSGAARARSPRQDASGQQAGVAGQGAGADGGWVPDGGTVEHLGAAAGGNAPGAGVGEGGPGH